MVWQPRVEKLLQPVGAVAPHAGEEDADREQLRRREGAEELGHVRNRTLAERGLAPQRGRFEDEVMVVEWQVHAPRARNRLLLNDLHLQLDAVPQPLAEPARESGGQVLSHEHAPRKTLG